MFKIQIFQKTYYANILNCIRDETGNCAAFVLLIVIYCLSLLLCNCFGGQWYYYFIGFIILIGIWCLKYGPDFEERMQEKKLLQQQEEREQALEYERKEKQRKAREQAFESERKKKQEDDSNYPRLLQKLLIKHVDLFDKFLEISERKVSVIDDYGDENWNALEKEIDILLKKIAEREGVSATEFKHAKKHGQFIGMKYTLLITKLSKKFRDYHKEQKAKPAKDFAIHNVSGVEFEVWLSKLFKENGYVNVRGTPKTGDQGADLIVERNDKTIIIQAKRHKAAVGNKAVQEVIGAVQYYNGDEGWVITTSSFTKSAKALAQKANIRLIDGGMLENFENL